MVFAVGFWSALDKSQRCFQGGDEDVKKWNGWDLCHEFWIGIAFGGNALPAAGQFKSDRSFSGFETHLRFVAGFCV